MKQLNLIILIIICVTLSYSAELLDTEKNKRKLNLQVNLLNPIINLLTEQIPPNKFVNKVISPSELFVFQYNIHLNHVLQYRALVFDKFKEPVGHGFGYVGFYDQTAFKGLYFGFNLDYIRSNDMGNIFQVFGMVGLQKNIWKKIDYQFGIAFGLGIEKTEWRLDKMFTIEIPFRIGICI